MGEWRRGHEEGITRLIIFQSKREYLLLHYTFISGWHRPSMTRQWQIRGSCFCTSELEETSYMYVTMQKWPCKFIWLFQWQEMLISKDVQMPYSRMFFVGSNFHVLINIQYFVFWLKFLKFHPWQYSWNGSITINTKIRPHVVYLLFNTSKINKNVCCYALI